MLAYQSDISLQKYLFHEGKNTHSYEFLGAHPTDCGILFRVWAPHAKSVSLVGEFNNWTPGATPMRKNASDQEIWEVLSEDIHLGDLYKYAVEGKDGETVFKADPYSFYSEAGTTEEGHQMASIAYDIHAEYKWKDRAWMKKRSGTDWLKEPMNIYEVHLGSWKRGENNRYLTYRELAEELLPYVEEMGYTHIELLPVTEYPFDGSWGYQTTGYFSITSRYGTPDDFKYFIDCAHKKHIGVIMDWVPAHFPKDAHGLATFDGTYLYEPSDPTKREHKGWGTHAFDFEKPEVVSFLTSSATFFCDKYHIDGIRVDAVAAMLYLDYCREEGEWKPNKQGGKESLEAVDFLKTLNGAILSEFPGALMIAEESTTWPMVTMPPQLGGLGFNFKWNMGWMNDTLEYFGTDPLFRRGVHHKLTFSTSYAYTENFILPISHDEVVHGKKSLLDKMPGEYEQKFAGLRAFFVYMMTHPGKKLLFMGSEFGQFIEWNEKQGLDWLLLDYDMHRKLQGFVKELNHYYQETPALWKNDSHPDGFRWIDADDMDNNVYSYYRIDDKGNVALVILNLSGQAYKGFAVGVPDASEIPNHRVSKKKKKEHYERVLSTDLRRFGGEGRYLKKTYPVKSGSQNGFARHISISLAPLSATVLERREDL